MCLVADVMKKDEEYARGVVRLEHANSPIIEEPAQYALNLMKLRREHVDRCEECKEGK